MGKVAATKIAKVEPVDTKKDGTSEQISAAEDELIDDIKHDEAEHDGAHTEEIIIAGGEAFTDHFEDQDHELVEDKEEVDAEDEEEVDAEDDEEVDNENDEE